MPKPKVTVKEAKLVKGIAQGKTKRQAAKDAGYSGSPETLSVRASNTLKKDNVQNALHEALSRAGITEDKVVAPVVEALDHQDLEMRLKGHDRAAKIMQPKTNDGGNTFIFNKGDVVKSKYVKD